jgi:Concanavalin A-like lectin/glucanases superfamily
MIRNVFFVLLAGCLCLLTSCGNNETMVNTAEFNDGTSAALFSIAVASNTPFAKIADSAVLTITAPDMNKITRTLTITDTSVTGTITGIPSGLNRVFEVLVYDSLDTLQYTGSATVNLPRNATVNVPISVYRIGSNAVINGTINETTIPGLKGYYAFDGNAKISSGSLPDGVQYGTITSCSDRFGKINSALAFALDGDSIVINFPDSTFSSMSISFWYTCVSPTNYYPGIIYVRSKAEDASKAPLNASFSLGVMGNAPQWVSGGKTGKLQISNYHNGIILESTSNPSYNKWHHVVYTYNKSDKSNQVFIDGILDVKGTGSAAGIDFMGADMIKIGSLNSFNTSFDDTQKKFVGSIDDVYFYDKVLTVTEITSLYNAK